MKSADAGSNQTPDSFCGEQYLRRRRWPNWTALCALIWTVCGALYLTLPPSPDQFNHAYLGWRLLNGGVPYRDVIDMNWPGVMWLHALATWLFGVNVWSWRALDYLLFGTACIFLCDLVRRAAGTRASRICAALSPAMYVTGGYWLAGQHDMSAAQFLLVALWAHVRGFASSAWRWQLLAGALLGLAILNKPTVGVMLALLPLHSLTFRVPARRVAANTAAVTAAMLATLLLGAMAVMALGTTRQELLEATVIYNVTARHSSAPDILAQRPRHIVPDFVIIHAWRWGAFTLASLLFLKWLGNRANRSPASTALCVLWFTGALSYFIQARGFVYHLAPAFLSFLGIVSITLYTSLGSDKIQARPAGYRLAGWLLVCGFLIFLMNRLLVSYGALPKASWTKDASAHLKRFRANDGISVADAVATAASLRSSTPGACFLLVGTGSSINYLAEQAQPTRFYYFPMIAQAAPPLPMAENWQKLWIADLRSTGCRYVAVNRKIMDSWITSSGSRGEALGELLLRYEQVGSMGSDGQLLLFRLR